MKMISLKKLVEDHDINIVSQFQGEGVSRNEFDVGSIEYREKENYIVKGEYVIATKPGEMSKVLYVERLEEGIEITINRPTIIAEDATPEDEAKLEEFINTPITAIVFHRKTLESAGKDIKRQHINGFTRAVVESYNKNKGEAFDEDFAVIEIDFVNKSVSIKRLGVE